MVNSPDEIRSAFNHQHPNHGGPEWVRLDLTTGPVLARRNIAHHSSPIYVVVVDKGIARHHMVTIKRQLKSNGTTSVPAAVREAWQALIGYTASEYTAAKTALGDDDHTRLYERGREVAR